MKKKVFILLAVTLSLVFVCCGAVFADLQDIQRFLNVTARVDVSKDWSSAGLSLSKGQQIRISVAENQTRQEFGETISGAGLEGQVASSQARVPGQPVNGLVAKIGDGEPFFVGNDASFVVESDGELFLGLNLDPDGYTAGGDETRLVISIVFPN